MNHPVFIPHHFQVSEWTFMEEEKLFFKIFEPAMTSFHILQILGFCA